MDVCTLHPDLTISDFKRPDSLKKQAVSKASNHSYLQPQNEAPAPGRAARQGGPHSQAGGMVGRLQPQIGDTHHLQQSHERYRSGVLTAAFAIPEYVLNFLLNCADN